MRFYEKFSWLWVRRTQMDGEQFDQKRFQRNHFKSIFSYKYQLKNFSEIPKNSYIVTKQMKKSFWKWIKKQRKRILIRSGNVWFSFEIPKKWVNSSKTNEHESFWLKFDMEHFVLKSSRNRKSFQIQQSKRNLKVIEKIMKKKFLWSKFEM